jgi:hypothetical protein
MTLGFHRMAHEINAFWASHIVSSSALLPSFWSNFLF